MGVLGGYEQNSCEEGSLTCRVWGAAAGMMSPGSSGGPAPAQRVVAERRWRLGVHSRGHPHRIIEDLLRALAAHKVAYKKMAPYNYKCRKVYPALGAAPALSSPPTLDAIVSMQLQNGRAV